MNFERIKSAVAQWTPDFVKNAFARIPRVEIHLSRWQQITAGVLVVVLGAGLLLWYLWPRPEIEVLPVVEVEPVKTEDVNIYGEYVGRIRAQQFVEIRARVEGYLEKMLFAEGTYIKKGQTLFVIDPRLYRARANKAAAQLNKARAQETKAKRDLDRIRPLYEPTSASQLDLDNAIDTYASTADDVAVRDDDLTQAQITLGYTHRQSPSPG